MWLNYSQYLAKSCSKLCPQNVVVSFRHVHVMHYRPVFFKVLNCVAASNASAAESCWRTWKIFNIEVQEGDGEPFALWWLFHHHLKQQHSQIVLWAEELFGLFVLQTSLHNFGMSLSREVAEETPIGDSAIQLVWDKFSDWVGCI